MPWVKQLKSNALPGRMIEDEIRESVGIAWQNDEIIGCRELPRCFLLMEERLEERDFFRDVRKEMS